MQFKSLDLSEMLICREKMAGYARAGPTRANVACVATLLVSRWCIYGCAYLIDDLDLLRLLPGKLLYGNLVQKEFR
jgi:hypothetical protein